MRSMSDLGLGRVKTIWARPTAPRMPLGYARRSVRSKFFLWARCAVHVVNYKSSEVKRIIVRRCKSWPICRRRRQRKKLAGPFASANYLSPPCRRAPYLLYNALRKEGTVTRQANYTIDVARKAWRVVARQHPGQSMVPVETAQGRTIVALNPFQGLERVQGRKTTTPATRDQAAALARALADIGHPALGAAALIAFEWHQRPENIIAGHLTWTVPTGGPSWGSAYLPSQDR